MADRRYDPEGTRQAILAAAQRIFVDKGVGNTSMNDIASAAGVTKSLIHHHFGSKDELWVAVKEASFDQYFRAILEIIRSEGKGNSPVRDVIEFMFQFHRQHPEMTRLLSWMHLDEDPGVHPLHEQVCREGIERLRRGQREGHLRDDVEAAWIQAIFLILTSGWFRGRAMYCGWDLGPEDEGGDRDERFLRDMLKIFFEGVRPRGRPGDGST